MRPESGAKRQRGIDEEFWGSLEGDEHEGGRRRVSLKCLRYDPVP